MRRETGRRLHQDLLLRAALALPTPARVHRPRITAEIVARSGDALTIHRYRADGRPMEQRPRGDADSHGRVWWTIGVAFAVPVVATVVAFLVSTAVTAVVAVTMFEDSSSEGEGDALAALAIWFSVGIAVLLVAAPIVGALFTRGSAPRRHRIVLTALYGWWAPAAVAGGGLAAWFGYRSGLEYLGAAIGLGFAIASISTMVTLTNAALTRRIWLAMAGVAAVFVVGVLVREPGFRQSIYADRPPPMGLVDEQALAAVLPGWQVMAYEDAPRDGGWPYARVTVATPSGADVVLTFVARDARCGLADEGCEPLGQLADGATVSVWSDSARCGSGSQPARLSVTAKRPTGYWSADPGSRCAGPVGPSSEQLRDLLGTVRPVTVEAWVDAT